MRLLQRNELPASGNERIGFIAIRHMKPSQAAGQLRLVLAVAIVLVLPGVLLLSLRSSGSVRLLDVGYSKEGNGQRVPLFCLTNGTSKPIAFSGSIRGGPTWRKEVRTASGWSDLHEGGWMSGVGLQTCVLRPGQSVCFVGQAIQSSKVWRAGVKYAPCERTLRRRVQANLPNLAPAWLKRCLGSEVRAHVAWSPELKGG